MIRTNKTRRFFTVVVSVCSLIVLLSLSTTAFAYNEFAGGAETEENPYLIENQDHLDCVRKHLGAHFRMTADVIFTPEDFSEEGFFWQGWSPIGDAEEPFTGTFDGNGHKIVGLYQNTAASEIAYMGLFGYTDSASIKNLSMDGSAFTLSTTKGSAYAGGIVGYAVNTHIENCANTGTITAKSSNSALAGGMAG